MCEMTSAARCVVSFRWCRPAPGRVKGEAPGEWETGERRRGLPRRDASAPGWTPGPGEPRDPRGWRLRRPLYGRYGVDLDGLTPALELGRAVGLDADPG